MRKSKIYSIQKLIFAGVVSVVLSACGGGGGGGGTTTTPTPSLTGVFTDSVVSGIAYSTETRSGFTDANGEYDYVAGETATFSIGDIVLGSAPAGPVVTPLTLVGTSDITDPQVTNIVSLLMTLDADGNPDNGIEITMATRTAAMGVTIDFNVPTADFAADATVAALIAAADTTSVALVDSGTAQTHLSNTIASSWGLMEWSSEVGGGRWSVN